MIILSWLAALITGFLASLGVGGGMVLIIYLTSVMGLGQIEAQGINLLFFIPIALISVIIHHKNKLVDIKTVLPAIITGAIGAAIGAFAAEFIGSELLGKAFSAFILIIGIREIFCKKNC